MTINEEWMKAIIEKSLFHSTVNGANILSQVAATTALRNCQEWLNDFVIHLEKMRNLFVDELNQIPGFKCLAPQGCYVAFADIRQTCMTSEEVRSWLLEQGRVAVVPGLKKWFGEGAEGFIRFSFATSQEILKEA